MNVVSFQNVLKVIIIYKIKDQRDAGVYPKILNDDVNVFVMLM